jgi:hypothetical protein
MVYFNLSQSELPRELDEKGRKGGREGGMVGGREGERIRSST